MPDSPDLDSPDPNRNWTVALAPGVKYTINAGEYDPETQKPHYSFKTIMPGHVGQMVKVKEYRIKTAGGDLQLWEIDNKSTWWVFAVVKRDGELIRFSNAVIRH